MEWWKATVLGSLVYALVSVVLSSVSLLLGAVLCLVPFVGGGMALVLNLVVTFAESIFSGFIAGNLSDRHKARVGFLAGMFGSFLEMGIRVGIFLLVAGAVGVSSLLNLAGFSVPLELLLGGGVIGSFILGITSAVAAIIASFGGHLGGNVSVELPLSRLTRQLLRRSKL